MPKAVSRYNSTRQIMHSWQSGSKYDASFNRKKESTKIAEAKAIPKLQANLF